MSRDITSDNLAEIRAKAKRPVFFLEAEFVSVTLRMWTGMGTIDWGGHTWYGPGTGPAAPGGVTGNAVLELGAVTETTLVEATGLTVKVKGFPAQLLQYCTDELRVGKTFSVWLGFMDVTGTVLVDDPLPWFPGWMDTADINQDAQSAEITLHIENEARRLQLPVLRRITLNDQQSDFATDALFKYVPGLKNWKGMWGSKQATTAGGGGTTSGGTGRSPVRPSGL